VHYGIAYHMQFHSVHYGIAYGMHLDNFDVEVKEKDTLEGRWYTKPELNAFKRSEEHTSELQSRENLVCRLLLEKKKNVATTYEATSVNRKPKSMILMLYSRLNTKMHGTTDG